MNLFDTETILLDESDLDILKKESKKSAIFLWKTSGMFLVIGLLGPFMTKTPSLYHPPRDLHDYLNRLYFIYAFVFAILIFAYYRTNYQIKRDIQNRTKLRFKALLIKSKPDQDLRRKDNYGKVILKPINDNPVEETEGSLFFFLKKNISPDQPLSVNIPKDQYIFVASRPGYH